MKKLLVIFGLLVCHSVYAFDSAKLKMQISGPIKDNRYFICVTNIGCVSILAGNRGKVYPMGDGTISNIFTVNMTNKRMYTQHLPSSCSVNLKNKQTFKITARLVEAGNRVSLTNLHCSVSG